MTQTHGGQGQNRPQNTGDTNPPDTRTQQERDEERRKKKEDARKRAHDGIDSGTHRGISCVTIDNVENVNLLGIFDSLLAQIRAKASVRGSGFSGADLDALIDKSYEIKEEINLLNAQMARKLKKPYRPPRGFKDPMLKEEQQAKAAEDVKAAVKAPKKKKKKQVPAKGPTGAPVPEMYPVLGQPATSVAEASVI